MEPNVVFFDGVCGLCNGFVDFVMKIDREKRFKFAPLQGEYAQKNLSPTDVMELKTIIVIIDGKTYKKSEAVLNVFQTLGGFWAPFAFLKSVPSFMRDKAYDTVAANRYTLFGKKDSCRLPTPQERQRFLL